MQRSGSRQLGSFLNSPSKCNAGHNSLCFVASFAACFVPLLDDDMEGLPIPLDVGSAEVFSKGQQELSDGRDFRIQAPLLVDFC